MATQNEEGYGSAAVSLSTSPAGKVVKPGYYAFVSMRDIWKYVTIGSANRSTIAISDSSGGKQRFAYYVNTVQEGEG